jgi:hypothetical protein
MYTGMNFFPLCTAMVWPMKSGTIVERRDQVFTTFFSLREFSPSTLTFKWSSTNGPFFSERGMLSPLPFSSLFDAAQFHPLRAAEFSKSSYRPGNAMRERAKRANKPRALRVRNLFHNYRPACPAKPEMHLRRRDQPRCQFR